MVSEASLIAAFERIADALGQDSLTFFEFNTLAALLVFETAAPDAIVLEVGMGGRLDAVNLVDADVAIVVSVGLDHMEWLGADVECIGREKAGIFRRGRPAVGRHGVPCRSPSSAARARRGCRPASLRAGLRRAARIADGTWDYRDASGELAGLPAPGLDGVVQIGQCGNGARGPARTRRRGCRLTRAGHRAGPARREPAGPLPAHAGGERLRVGARRRPQSGLGSRAGRRTWRATALPGRTIAVCGMLADKDVESVVEILRDRVDRWIAAAPMGRARSTMRLARGARACASASR